MRISELSDYRSAQEPRAIRRRFDRGFAGKGQYRHLAVVDWPS
jgi:hypothetical protein